MTTREMDQWIDDFDNLFESGHFDNQEIKDHVFYHNEMDMKQFLARGREMIRQSLMYKLGDNTHKL